MDRSTRIIIVILLSLGALFYLVGTALKEAPYDDTMPRGSEEQVGGVSGAAATLTCEEQLQAAYPREVLEAEDLYEGEIASVDFSSDPEAEMFATVIRQEQNRGPNFAGHFTVATWGCGTECQEHAVVDSITGEIVKYKIMSQYGASYSPDSNVLVTNPKDSFLELLDNEDRKLVASGIKREYHLLLENEGNVRLELVCTEDASVGL